MSMSTGLSHHLLYFLFNDKTWTSFHADAKVAALFLTNPKFSLCVGESSFFKSILLWYNLRTIKYTHFESIV